MKINPRVVGGPFGDLGGYLHLLFEGLVPVNKINPEVGDFFLLKNGITRVVIHLDLLEPREEISIDESLRLISAHWEPVPIHEGKQYVYRIYDSDSEMDNQYHSINFGIVKVFAEYVSPASNKVRIIFQDKFGNPVADRMLEPNREYVLKIDSTDVIFSTRWVDVGGGGSYTIHLISIRD